MTSADESIAQHYRCVHLGTWMAFKPPLRCCTQRVERRPKASRRSARRRRLAGRLRGVLAFPERDLRSYAARARRFDDVCGRTNDGRGRRGVPRGVGARRDDCAADSLFRSATCGPTRRGPGASTTCAGGRTTAEGVEAFRAASARGGTTARRTDRGGDHALVLSWRAAVKVVCI